LRRESDGDVYIVLDESLDCTVLRFAAGCVATGMVSNIEYHAWLALKVFQYIGA
jgi:hypothetical protein